MVNWLAVLEYSIIILGFIGIWAFILWIFAILTRKILERRYRKENDKGRRSKDFPFTRGNLSQPLFVGEPRVFPPRASNFIATDSGKDNGHSRNIERIKAAFRKVN